MATVKTVARVEIEGHAVFTAEVDVNQDNLDADHMPLHMTGAFTKLPSNSEIHTELDGRPHNQPIPGDCKHRFHLDNRQAGHNALRSRLADDAFDVFGARFLVVELSRALVSRKELAKSAFFPGCDHGVRERSRN